MPLEDKKGTAKNHDALSLISLSQRTTGGFQHVPFITFHLPISSPLCVVKNSNPLAEVILLPSAQQEP
jgi:hypothetical protein